MHLFKQKYYRIIPLSVLLFVSAYHYLYALDMPEINIPQKKFVLDSWQIHIPNYPHAFNPSIIRWNNKLLMAFRHCYKEYPYAISKIGLIWLDDDFNPISSTQLLDTAIPNAIRPPAAEDPRLFTLNEHLYITYNDEFRGFPDSTACRIHVAELIENESFFSIQTNDRITNFPKAIAKRAEKNWVPFDFKGELYFTYGFHPYRNFNYLPEKKYCNELDYSYATLTWDIDHYGDIRGGTPALMVNGEYLAFFHTVKLTPLCKPIYYVGAYTFQSKPPFAITRISSEPIFDERFYADSTFTKVVMWPAGYVFDNQFIWLVYGKNDQEVHVVKLDKMELLNSLISAEIFN